MAYLAEYGLAEFENISMQHFVGSSTVRRVMDQLSVADYTVGMVVAEEAHEQNAMNADSHSMSTLLLLRDIQMSGLPVEALGETQLSSFADRKSVV